MLFHGVLFHGVLFHGVLFHGVLQRDNTFGDYIAQSKLIIVIDMCCFYALHTKYNIWFLLIRHYLKTINQAVCDRPSRCYVKQTRPITYGPDVRHSAIYYKYLFDLFLIGWLCLQCATAHQGTLKQPSPCLKMFLNSSNAKIIKSKYLSPEG